MAVSGFLHRITKVWGRILFHLPSGDIALLDILGYFPPAFHSFNRCFLSVTMCQAWILLKPFRILWVHIAGGSGLVRMSGKEVPIVFWLQEWWELRGNEPTWDQVVLTRRDNCSWEGLEARELGFLELKEVQRGRNWERWSWRYKQEGVRLHRAL